MIAPGMDIVITPFSVQPCTEPYCMPAALMTPGRLSAVRKKRPFRLRIWLIHIYDTLFLPEMQGRPCDSSDFRTDPACLPQITKPSLSGLGFPGQLPPGFGRLKEENRLHPGLCCGRRTGSVHLRSFRIPMKFGLSAPQYYAGMQEVTCVGRWLK